MNFNKEMLSLYAITDRAWTLEKTIIEQIEEAILGGATIIQLREKELKEEEFIKEAIKAVEICHKYKVALIINDNLKVALKSNADGIHVGIEDMPVAEIRKKVSKDFIIGATAKTVEQAKKAQESGANYIGVGAVFPSPTKKNAVRITQKQLREICESVTIPAVAIGGIDKNNIHELFGTKIAGAAVVSAIFGAENIKEAAEELKGLVNKYF